METLDQLRLLKPGTILSAKEISPLYHEIYISAIRNTITHTSQLEDDEFMFVCIKGINNKHLKKLGVKFQVFLISNLKKTEITQEHLYWLNNRDTDIEEMYKQLIDGYTCAPLQATTEFLDQNYIDNGVSFWCIDAWEVAECFDCGL